MPQPFGDETKTLFLKSESHKLFNEFEVGTVKLTLTLAGDLITANVINGSITGSAGTSAIAPVTFATDHDTTMDLIVAALKLLTTVVVDATLTDATNNRQITVWAKDPDAAFTAGADWLVTAGASQTTITRATDTNNIKKGQLVRLQSDGTVEPCPNGDYRHVAIGVAMHNGEGKDLITVMMKAFAIVMMECATDGLLAGPVTIHSNGVNATTGYLEVDDASVTAANMVGWALESGDDGDVIQVAVCV